MKPEPAQQAGSGLIQSGYVPAMRFRKDARLDPSQVEDYRGRGGGLPGGMPVTLGGGGGLIGIIVLLAFLFLSGGGGGGDLGSLAGQTVGPSGPSGELSQE